MNFKGRVDKLIGLLREKGLDAVILGDRANVRYFSGIRFNTASFSILFVSKNGDVVLLTAVLDYNRVKRNCWIKDIRKFPEDDPNYLNPLKQLLHGRNIKRVGVEFSNVTVERENLIREVTNAELINIENDLLRLRMVKDTEEIEIIRAAAKIAEKAMIKAVESIREGIREYEVSAVAQDVMMREGAEGLSFEPFVMSGENAWLPQRFSSDKELKKGELVLFDMGCVYRGYCSDITRTFSLGGLSDEQKHLFRVAYEAQQKAIEAVKPGVAAEDIDKAARDYITQKGYGDYFPHLTGHGLGLSIHEMPIVDVGSKILLEPGMIFTVEPGVYVEGLGAARVEDMVLVTDSGYELLTNAPRELV
ncbi:M24 family metallopeptidase [Thermoanaerobacterium sp. DL9XJH110]|uniref:M24 family metallopeptidase n=1 Tax=Thermoanaerobacterium sp. DL9XJH110 TaxID=3386643 RepID=UPI003BB4BBCB